ncbi:MAG: hypothetical protein WD824_02755 [Cyclobacteriaceae bacterium]
MPKRIPKRASGHLLVPKTFSLTEAPKESFNFINSLFCILYNDAADALLIDYAECEKIDLDAQVLMDVLLKDFIEHLHRCRSYGQIPRIKFIEPTNFKDKDHVEKILYSIGSFRVLKKVHINYPNIITYNLCIGRKKIEDDNERFGQKDIHTTQLIDYVLKSLEAMGRKLTPEAISDLCQVVGEVLINAEEHATTENRYSIGFFEEKTEEANHYGVFNLVIFNFGQTIYEKFKDPACPTQHIVARMKDLSSQYTEKGFFQPAEFEEETLWTLYSLQEGVTSKVNYKKRGNGSIRFIESFFNLKGTGLFKDDESKLLIMSGNARVLFDGSYEVLIRQKGPDTFKVVAFNNSGSFDEKPNKKFVYFAENYFPGTMIVAKILIREEDLISQS